MAGVRLSGDVSAVFNKHPYSPVPSFLPEAQKPGIFPVPKVLFGLFGSIVPVLSRCHLVVRQALLLLYFRSPQEA